MKYLKLFARVAFFTVACAFLYLRVTAQPKGRRNFLHAANKVVLDGQSLSFRSANKEVCHIEIPAISEIKIHTTDEGPRFQDMFWELKDGSKNCVLENAADGFEAMVLKFKTLKKFSFDNYRVIIEASGSTDDATFLVWSRL